MTAIVLLLSFLSQADAPEVLYERGVQAYNAGRYEEAVAALEQAAAQRSDVPDYRFHLGLAYLKTGEPRKASRELEAALGMLGLKRETRLKEPLVLVQAAIAYLHQGDARTARMRAELAAKKSEPSADIEYILGLVAREEGNEEEALSRFAAAVELDRDHREANLALGNALARQGRLDEALEALRHATHRDGGSYEVYMELGELTYGGGRGDLEQAAEAFSYALEERPGDPSARFNLGTVRLAQQRYSEAVEQFLGLDGPAAMFHLGEAYRASGAYEEAKAVLGDLLAQEPEHLEARLALALVLEALDDASKAEELYRTVLDAHPEEMRALLNLAALVERTGRPHEAVPLLQKAVPLASDEAERARIQAAIDALTSR